VRSSISWSLAFGNRDRAEAPQSARCLFLAHRDGRHFDGQLSLSGHCGHGWTCGLPGPVAMTQGNCRAGTGKGACTGPDSARSSCRLGCRLLILIAAPFSSRLSRYTCSRRDPLHSPSGHAELRCDLVEAWPPRSRQSVTDSLFHLGDCARPPEGFPALGAARLGPSNASAHALDNHTAFELGKHAHHLKHGLAGRRRGVDAISGFARAPGASLQNDLVNKYPREIGSTPLRSGTRAWVTSGRPREFRFPDRGIRGQHF